ncbi:hypothetical protein V9T40_010136 [Parthenolecanium corni]|uniref:Uncharacterized protein n=1 Tax=Parthenolecanium corni TaxID=536013 RepID=A0AAN9T452_9HEMI
MTSSLNRFNRALDSLKKVISKTPEEINRQKLKFTSYATITELVCKSNDKSSLLTIAVTSLIQLLESADSNNRLNIDESLNKIIRSSIDNSNDIAKVLIALLKILSKSTNERSLKAALWRFAELAHFVRPHKGKIYVQTLIPVLIKLAARKEDGIHEVSVSSFPRIFRYIGLFTSDNDIKNLLKAFFKNLSSSSVEIRRAAAFIVTVICQYSRKPEFFFSHSLCTLLDLLADAQINDQKNVLLIQGCLSCIRQILSCTAKPRPELENELDDKNLEYLLQIYEFCFKYASYQDHNVVTAALETLHQLLLSAFASLVEKLMTKGITQSSVLRREHHGSTLSLTARSEIFSVGSIIAQSDDDIFSGELGKKINALRRGSESFPDVSEEQKQKMTENWVQEQSENDEDDVSSSSLLNMDTSHFANSDDEDNQCEVDSTLSFRTLSVDNIQIAKEMNEKNSLNRSKSAFQSMKSMSVMSSASLGTSLINLSTDIDIGDVFDENEIPLQYCARFLVTRFLISDKNDSVRPTRVSVMSLALNCLAQIMKIYPMSGFISVVKDKEIYEDFANLLEVVLSHASHSDQQIRGLVRVVIGNFISASLVEDYYLLIESNTNILTKSLLTELVSFLLQGLEDESSMCVRHCLQGVSVCLEPLLLTPEYKLAVPLLDFMFSLMDNPYWLIKVIIKNE